MLHDLTLGRGVLPSTSLILCLSVPSGSRTRMTFETLKRTCRMAVFWKKGAAPNVVPGIRVVIVMSDCDDRVAICAGRT